MTSAETRRALRADAPSGGMASVLKNGRFLALWLSQLATQVGGNMVLFALTILVYRLTFNPATGQGSSTSVSLLLLAFLVPAVIFSAVAGVYVDRIDRRLILIVTNVLRAAAFLGMFVVAEYLGGTERLVGIYLLTILVATLTTFFGPAEAAMIPIVVNRAELLSANGLFTFTLQASFALGFAVLGPLFVTLFDVDMVLFIVAGLYLVAGLLCWRLPAHHPRDEEHLMRGPIGKTERAVAGIFGQLREGLSYIRKDAGIFWALTYLAITASLIGVLGVLGPDFAIKALGLREQDFVVVVLPIGAGLVIGILALNVYGKFIPRRRVIEGGMLAMAAALAALSLAGPISGLLQRADRAITPIDLGPLVSLLAVVVVLALILGFAYAWVAVPAQTQLQEELPADVRGRVFGVLNMLVSVASFLPIVIVGPVADLIGTPAVIMGSAVFVALTGLASLLKAPSTGRAEVGPTLRQGPVDPVSVATSIGSSVDLSGAPDRPLTAE
ncbi:MAG: MFS transporter, partial [Chloroflexi bacterium]|nr:MFS transporter [Chloroflexota bacterium]